MWIHGAWERPAGSSPCPPPPRSPSKFCSFAWQSGNPELPNSFGGRCGLGLRATRGMGAGLMSEVPETPRGLKQAASFLCASACLLHDEDDNLPNCLWKL